MTGISLFRSPGSPRHASPATPAGSPEPDPSSRPAPSSRRLSSRRSKPTRHPAAGLAAAIGLGLLAAFFAWQAAAPLWLALGRGEAGTATVTRCEAATGAPVAAAGTPAAARPPGASYRCVVFQATSGAFRAVDITLFGAGEAGRTEGVTVPARMLSPAGDRAYAASPAGLHLRWIVAMALVLACGAGTAFATGATRLDRPRRRRLAVLCGFAGPLLLAAGFVIAAY